MRYLKDYIQASLADGKYFFTRDEVLKALNITKTQFKYQAYRLARNKSIFNLINGFYMIIPAEYKHLGSLPPHSIIDPLMKYLKEDYYIGLLSAAAFHGSAHQQPMVFQVFCVSQRRNIKLERGVIEFHSKKDCNSSFIEKISTLTGYAKISSKEQTIIDLIQFYSVSGYMSNVANVIKELAEEIDYERFKEVVEGEATKTILQRAGYIVELLGYEEMAKIIENRLKKFKTRVIDLRPDYLKDGEINHRWKLRVNDTLELEE